MHINMQRAATIHTPKNTKKMHEVFIWFLSILLPTENTTLGKK